MPVECVARGYLAGSAAGRSTRRAAPSAASRCPPGLQEASKLPEPIFTPATKEEGGARREHLASSGWPSWSASTTAAELRDRTLDVYRRAAAYAESRGHHPRGHEAGVGPAADGRLILIDEVLTPDSSRFWPEDTYRPGSSPPSFDKQFVRDWLETTGWDKNSPPPQLPREVVEQTAAKYREALGDG